MALFPKAMMLSTKFCLAIANHHKTGGGVLPNVHHPKCMDNLEKHNGTAEDTNGIFQAFEKYLIKLLKLLGDKQRDEEEGIMSWVKLVIILMEDIDALIRFTPQE